MGLTPEIVRKLKEKLITQSRLNRAGVILARKRLVNVYETKDFIWGEVSRWKRGDKGLLPYMPAFRSDGAFMCTCRAFAVNPEIFCSHLISVLLTRQSNEQMVSFIRKCVEREVNIDEN